MFLSDLIENQSAVISFSDNESIFGKRLCDMGIRNGERVVCVKRGLFSSPIIYGARGSLIALRKRDAEKIEVVL